MGDVIINDFDHLFVVKKFQLTYLLAWIVVYCKLYGTPSHLAINYETFGLRWLLSIAIGRLIWKRKS